MKMMINNKMEAKTVVKLRKMAKKSHVSTECQQNLQFYKRNYPLFTNLLFAFFARCFLLLGSVLILQLRCVFFFLKKIAQTLKIKEITFHTPGNFSFYKIVHAFAGVKSEPQEYCWYKGLLVGVR